MQRIEYKTIDKSLWPRGEWDNEPDKIQWQDEATGFPCLIVRSHTGALCGYVGIPEDHPFHGKAYDAVDLSVHGGLTYSDSCQANISEDRGICHRPAPDEPDHVWWFGFDCAHSGDAIPLFLTSYSQYRNLAYVTAEVEGLAKQLKEHS